MGERVKLSVHGLKVTPLRQVTDERGAVLTMLRSDAPEFAAFGEVYFSEIQPGAVKAWKRHRRQTQNIAVPVGRVRLVVLDDRPGSVSRGTLDELELGRPDRYVRVRIPPGLWYGFKGLGRSPALIANCTDFLHDPAESDGREPDDSAMPFSWDVG